MYNYKLISTGDSSAKYGNCEVCGKHCTEIFQQIETQDYIDENNKVSQTHYGCNSYFGHKECLESKQR
jgi:hypothetical protein